MSNFILLYLLQGTSHVLLTFRKYLSPIKFSTIDLLYESHSYRMRGTEKKRKCLCLLVLSPGDCKGWDWIGNAKG